jgi:DNA polymerase I-like protein with 3'-5' exonuclease and polymerase domains
MKAHHNWTDRTIQRQILPNHHSGIKLDQWKSNTWERHFESFSETWDIPESLLKIQQLEHDLLPILASMEQTGIMLDRDRLMELGKQIVLEGDQHRAFIESVVGSGYNLASPKQLQELLF